jgi:hypothetical protein
MRLSSRTTLPVAELAHALTAALGAAGYHVRLVEDRLPPVRDVRATIVLGRHDVLPHLDLDDGRGLTAVPARSVLISCTSPGGTEWDLDLGYAGRAGAVMHVSDLGVDALGEAGLSARRFALGYHRTLDRRHGADAERPVDVAVLGSTLPRREGVIAAAAEILADLRTRDPSQPTAWPARSSAALTAAVIARASDSSTRGCVGRFRRWRAASSATGQLPFW